MMDDWNHLMYHRDRAVELHRRAAIDREIHRARSRERAARMAYRKEMVSTVFHAVIAAHKAAKMARQDAWTETISTLKAEKPARVA